MNSSILIDQQTITASQLPEVFAIRDPHGNKGSFGTVGLLGGSLGMTGAIILAGRAALKSGAGKVFVGMTQDPLPLPYDQITPELMLRHAQDLIDSPQNITGWGAGCGLGDSTASVLQLRRLFTQRRGTPLTLDADGLNALAAGAVAPTWGQGVVVLTPHPAEAARLLQTTTDQIQSNRPAAAKAIAKIYSCWVVLKGAESIVCAPDQSWQTNTTGNVGLASGGTGDVLTGVITSLLAQGISTPQAICGAVWLHGAAADYLVSKGIGPIGLGASDLLDAIRDLRNQVLRR